jgi:hypothetical protein
MIRPTEKLVKTAYRVMNYLVDTPHSTSDTRHRTYPELRNRIYTVCDVLSTTEAELVRRQLFYDRDMYKQHESGELKNQTYRS